MSSEAAFLDYCRTVGLGPAKAISLPAGELVRYRGEGDKPSARNCWAVFHAQPHPWGVVGSWRTGERHAWRAETPLHMSRAERRELQRQREQAEVARRNEQARVYAAAREKALRLWHLARPATDAHPYLARKGVHAYGIRRLGERLVIPARTADGELHTLQFIGPDGGKRFLTGGRVGACYCSIGKPDHTLLVCEGYATAATLFETTGHAVAAAFSANNLERVALALRSKFPRAHIVVCGDDDAHTAGNPGRTAALAAAKAVGGQVALPTFKETGR